MSQPVRRWHFNAVPAVITPPARTSVWFTNNWCRKAVCPWCFSLKWTIRSLVLLTLSSRLFSAWSLMYWKCCPLDVQRCSNGSVIEDAWHSNPECEVFQSASRVRSCQILSWSQRTAFWCRRCFRGVWRLSGGRWIWQPTWILWFWGSRTAGMHYWLWFSKLHPSIMWKRQRVGWSRCQLTLADGRVHPG